MNHYTPSRARSELQAQHQELRRMLDRCEQLADELDGGRVAADQLALQVTRLRVAFDAHNKLEEQVLRPVLLDSDACAEVRVERIIEDHVGEHRAMRARMTTETAELRDVIEMLRAHLDTEERYVLDVRGPVPTEVETDSRCRPGVAPRLGR